MRHAVRRAASSLIRPLAAALQLTLPLAHGIPSVSSTAEPQLTAKRHSQHPTLSALDDLLVPTGHTPVAVREQVIRWVQHVSIQMVKSTWAGDVRWVCSRAGWTWTPPHRPPPGCRLLARRGAFPTLTAGSNEHPTPHRCTASTARGRDTLECACCSEGGSALRVRWACELPSYVKPTRNRKLVQQPNHITTEANVTTTTA
jgi:hypothetical protein